MYVSHFAMNEHCSSVDVYYLVEKCNPSINESIPDNKLDLIHGL